MSRSHCPRRRPGIERYRALRRYGRVDSYGQMGRAGSIGMSSCSRVRRLLKKVLFVSWKIRRDKSRVVHLGRRERLWKDCGRNFVVSCFLTRSSRPLSGLITRLFGMALAGRVDVGVDKATCSRHSFQQFTRRGSAWLSYRGGYVFPVPACSLLGDDVSFPLVTGPRRRRSVLLAT